MESPPSNANPDYSSFHKDDIAPMRGHLYEALHEILDSAENHIQSLDIRIGNLWDVVDLRTKALYRLTETATNYSQRLTRIEETLSNHELILDELILRNPTPPPLPASHVPGQEIGDPAG